MILVIGATGVVGRHVTAQLLEAGEDVRALVRDREAALSPQVKVVQGDLGDRESLAAALSGVEKVFLLTTGGPETPLHDANLATTAADAGVKHIVKLSIIGAEYGFSDLVSTWHLAGERTLRQVAARPGGPAWTFLRPGEFMSNVRLWANQIKTQGKVFWASTEPAVAVVDPRDVAAMAVTVLTTPGHEGKTYRFGGPEALTVAERVGKIAAALGRDIELVEVPIPALLGAVKKAGRQPLVVETTLGNLGREEFRIQAKKVLPVFAEVVGRPPHTFDEWLAAHLDIFR
ncbi:Uncharacterized conserved protein YbjT, contains NAD(P)-binding and DUF2867 domains [Amycolatopsis xylanica]|uniref:Uncharacterized conserved protein YbjT, contains NAD(P)-binding and DUF2867 domains n=1 Tax=Amycolatopsis xylanica TaxID=589385 RepID=A0A1H3DB12_9PSEU|nr:NAD(P)H-binding protein [Amycolatopsis xylanica]SDX62869.1 Uncharacterized conserved protein YbjT, contains NAD(P)-binding and DUF2867 domains [Amycolatopsis xylanica]